MSRRDPERKWTIWLGGSVLLVAIAGGAHVAGLSGLLTPPVIALVFVFVTVVGGGIWAYRRTVRFQPGGADRDR